MCEGKKNKVAFLGGDGRMIAAALRFFEYGYSPVVFGVDGSKNVSNGICGGVQAVVDSGCCSSAGSADTKDVELVRRLSVDKLSFATTPFEAVSGCEAVILPLPVSADGANLQMPLNGGNVLSLKQLANDVKAAGVRLVCGGKIPEKFSEDCACFGISMFDYYEQEEFAVANAVPTAEGAIEIAMRELPLTIHDLQVLVIGYGRIGKVLTELLAGLGAKVTVSARKERDFAWIRAGGFDVASTESLSDIEMSRFDAVFNTVPRVVLGRKELSLLSPDALIVDLASKPGGIDCKAARDLGRRVIWALSLPGKVAPVTAGRIIADTVVGYIRKKGGEQQCL